MGWHFADGETWYDATEDTTETETEEVITMADLTRHDMQIIDEHDRHQREMMVEQLERLGIQLRIAHFTGDSSYPTEYSLRYSFVQAVGPTFDLAIAEFIEKLLKHVPVEQVALTPQQEQHRAKQRLESLELRDKEMYGG